MNFSVKNRNGRKLVRVAALSAAAIIFADGSKALAQNYVWTGPNNGDWNDANNWTYVWADTGVTPPNHHDVGTVVPGISNSTLTTTTDINNGIANSNVIFNYSGTASIGRLYLASNNAGPDNTTGDTYSGWDTMTTQPQVLTIQAGALNVDAGQFTILGRHANAKIVQTGGSYNTGQNLRFGEALGTVGTYEYHAGDLTAGVSTAGSNPGVRLGGSVGTSGTMIIQNDGPGHIHLYGYFSASAGAASGGFANIGLTEFHYENGGIRTIRDEGQVSLRNDKDAPSTNYSSQLSFALDSTPTTDGDHVPQNMALFTAGSITKGGGTDFAVFYKQGGTTGRYLDRNSGYAASGGRAYDPATDSFVVSSSRAGVNYLWDISYSGKGTWDGTFDNITNVTGHGTGTDIVLMGRSSYIGQQWTTASDGNWSTGPWDGAEPNAIGAGANFFKGNSSGAVNVNVDHPVIVGELQFDNVNRSGPNVSFSGVIDTSYTLSGSGITIQTSSGEGLIRTIDNSHTIASSLTLNSNTRMVVSSATNTLTVSNLQPSAVTVTKSGPGTLAVNNVRAAALNVAAGKVRIIGNGSFTGTSKVPSLTLAAGTTLDLTDNKLVTASAIGAWNGSNYDGITGLITTGRNGGSWNGTGIITSKTAAASPSTLTTIAVATGAQVKGISGAQTASWGGQTVAAADTLVMYTYTGDADLSGKINADDYFRIDSSYNKNGVVYGYSNGDFNYDGQINGDDYALIDSAFSGQGSAFATASDVGGVSAVPEPAGLALVVVGALLARRRR